MSNGNFKVKCLKTYGNNNTYTTGKIYEFINGFMVCDDGSKMPGRFTTINTFEDWSDWSTAKWELVTELSTKPSTEYISIIRKKNSVAATITQGENKFTQSISLSKANGDYKTAVKMVVDRLMERWNGFEVEEIEAVDKIEGNFKARCTKTIDDGLTNGKVYEFINGYSKFDNGEIMPNCDKLGVSKFKTFKDMEKWFSVNGWSDFEEVKEEAVDKPLTADGFKVGDRVLKVGGPHDGEHGTVVSMEALINVRLDSGIVWVCSKSEIKLLKPTIKEVHRPAKVGEWVKVSAEYNDDRFKLGEIYQVKDTNGNDALVPHQRGMSFQCKGCARLVYGNYVVLENYQPEEHKPMPSTECQFCHSTTNILTVEGINVCRVCSGKVIKAYVDGDK